MRKINLEEFGTVYDGGNDMSLFTFAFCGLRSVFEQTHLSALANLAEKEKWSPDQNDPQGNSYLFYYITKTFEQCHHQSKIAYSETRNLAVFNTGLITDHAEDIFGVFVPNRKRATDPNSQEWFFQGFMAKSNRFLTNYSFPDPKLASYSNNPGDFYFKTEYEILPNMDHIFNDHFEDPERYPQEILSLGRDLAIAAIKQAFEVAKIKVKRNNRLVVPQFYNGKIMYLMPINVPKASAGLVTMALAIEETQNGKYRANTIFKLCDAYKKARLLMKPESNWLCE